MRFLWVLYEGGIALWESINYGVWRLTRGRPRDTASNQGCPRVLCVRWALGPASEAKDGLATLLRARWLVLLCARCTLLSKVLCLSGRTDRNRTDRNRTGDAAWRVGCYYRLKFCQCIYVPRETVQSPDPQNPLKHWPQVYLGVLSTSRECP